MEVNYQPGMFISIKFQSAAGSIPMAINHN